MNYSIAGNKNTVITFTDFTVLNSTFIYIDGRGLVCLSGVLFADLDQDKVRAYIEDYIAHAPLDFDDENYRAGDDDGTPLKKDATTAPITFEGGYIKLDAPDCDVRLEAYDRDDGTETVTVSTRTSVLAHIVGARLSALDKKALASFATALEAELWKKICDPDFKRPVFHASAIA